MVIRSNSLVGANIEDLNFQLYGGLYSQLLHGECFEENVDPTDLLGLTGPARFAVWVVFDEKGQPVLRRFPGRGGGVYRPNSPADVQPGDKLGKPPAQPPLSLPFSTMVGRRKDLPKDLYDRLVALASGPDQASRHWRKVQMGSATGALTLVRQGVFTGKQAQQIAFTGGKGEFGIDNAGLFREGFCLVAGKPYDGILRIKSENTQTVVVSLRGEKGAVLAEQPLSLAAKPGEYQRLAFALTPTAADPRGRFAITLKQPGAITVDYAYLQPGDWGRFKGLPVRKELAEAALSMGIATMRYNGSMVNRNRDGAEFYKWKRMIGPRDERVPYPGFFNPYASHGFSVFEFMDFCEAAGIWPVIGLRTDETEADMADLVDYCLGDGRTEWGKRRIANGHPQPYLLKTVQIGNEEAFDDAYLARVKALGAAIWSKNRAIDIMLSVNMRSPTSNAVLVSAAQWARSLGQSQRLVLDSHYRSAINTADTSLDTEIGLRAHDAVAQAVPGLNLRLWPMEENGNACDWSRGLAHAHNLTTMNRMPASLERAGVANTFQPFNLALVWDQGRIHYTPSRVYYQPSYYVDRMFADEWLPLVVHAESSAKTIDVTAKKNADGSVLTVYLVNINSTSATLSFAVTNFAPRSVQVMRIGASNLDAHNTPETPDSIVSRTIPWQWAGAASRLELPGYSFTTVRLTK